MREEDEIDAEIIQPFELHFSDLITLSSPTLSSSSSKQELERLESITTAVMQTLGPSGPGLLTITGVPKASELRRNLLPLARKLALLPNDDRRRILKDHCLGSDVSLKNPDRSVSSFAMQLKYVQNPTSDKGGENSKKQSYNADGSNETVDYEFNSLGTSFKELGVCMMDLGLQLARVCDRAIGGKELEQSVLDSSSAKGRLIHYHSTLDELLLREIGKLKGYRKKITSHPLGDHHGPEKSGTSDMVCQTPVEDSNMENEARSCKTSFLNLWQQWHYDYGIFTVLTAPMFISSGYQRTTETKDGPWKTNEQEHPPPNGHTCLQIFDTKKNKIFMVRSPPDSFIIQVGESADVISQGKLQSTLHSVSRPVKLKNLSRETFVVFLQPAWDKTFSISQYHKESLNSSEDCFDVESPSSSTLHHPEQPPKLYEKIHEIIPPLSSRLKDGMTFAEFSRETTKQYYSGSGVQSNR